ncbi:hypothetical protein [Polyangium fumosum]|nr:hypothetical protein [Polyangium fumosum]
MIRCSYLSAGSVPSALADGHQNLPRASLKQGSSPFWYEDA